MKIYISLTILICWYKKILAVNDKKIKKKTQKNTKYLLDWTCGTFTFSLLPSNPSNIYSSFITFSSHQKSRATLYLSYNLYYGLSILLFLRFIKILTNSINSNNSSIWNNTQITNINCHWKIIVNLPPFCWHGLDGLIFQSNIPISNQIRKPKKTTIPPP